MPVPVVKARANWRCQAQISIELQLFGEPKALIRRSTQGCASDSAVPELVVTPNATASGPLSDEMRRNAAAVSSRASSHEIRCQPGSGSPFGRVRRSGYKSRSSAYTSPGEARPLAHSDLPVGCDGSGSIATSRPPSTTASQPQRDTQRAQKAGMRRREFPDMRKSPTKLPNYRKDKPAIRLGPADGRMGRASV